MRRALRALLGVCLELGLEGGELGKRRVRIGLLLALTPRDVVAALSLLVTILGKVRSLAALPFGAVAARAIRPIAVPLRTLLRTLFPLTPPGRFAFAIPAKFARRATSTSTMLLGGLFRRCSGGFSPRGLKVDSNANAARTNGHIGARSTCFLLPTASPTADTISFVVIVSDPANTIVCL